MKHKTKYFFFENDYVSLGCIFLLVLMNDRVPAFFFKKTK
jgi:hypothetical protein